MFYGSYSRGFKAGGWTTRLSNPLADINDAAFGPEKDKTYELGVKSQFLDNHLQVNAAVFDSKYTGIQLNIQEAASPVLHNAGDAKLRGAELELEAVVTGGFSIMASAAYIDAKYDTVSPAAASQGITTSNKIPKTPETKSQHRSAVRPGAAQQRQAAVRCGLHAHLSHGATTRQTNTPLLHRPSVDNLNAAIHYFSPEQRYQVSLGGTNLTDERYIVVGSVNWCRGRNRRYV